MTTPLVSFNHLSVSFAGERSRVRAVQEDTWRFRFSWYLTAVSKE